MSKTATGLLFAFLLVPSLIALLSGCSPIGPFSQRREAVELFLDARREYASAASLTAKLDREAPENSASLEKEIKKGLEKSLEKAQKAIAVDPLFLSSHLLALQLLSLLDRPAACSKEIDYLLGLFPDEESIRERAVVWKFHSAGGAKKAEAILDEGLARNPAYPRFHLLKAELLADSGKKGDEIRDRIRILLSFEDLSAETWFRMIGLCVHLSSQGPDEELCRPLLTLARKKPEYLDGTLAWLFAAGMEKPSKPYFLFAANLTGAGFRLKLEAARLLIRLEDTSEAAEQIDSLSRVPPPGKEESNALLALKGHLERLRGKKDAALSIFRKVIEEDPANIDALEGFWILYENTPLVGIEEVRAVFRKAAEAARDPAVRAFLKDKVQTLGTGPKEEEGKGIHDSGDGSLQAPVPAERERK